MVSDSGSAAVPQEHDESKLETSHRSLAESIMMATRPSHTIVNKLITARVALALPPYSTDPSPYITGLLHIAPIYLAFEERWKIILTENSVEDLESTASDSQGPGRSSQEPSGPPPISSRIYTFLEKLYMPELMRSKRLKADIASLTGWPNYIVEGQLANTGQSGQLGELILHMETAFEYRPHVLAAYAYILHMALFAGGRYMRASFQSAGDSFWQILPSPVKPSQLPCRQAAIHPEPTSELTHETSVRDVDKMPLRFFHFESTEDGDDLKREFKKRLSDLESLLTDCERDEILKEGVCLFENVQAVIHQLDAICASSEPLDAKGLAGFRALSRMINPPISRARDSVAVAKERGMKPSKTGGDTSSAIKQTTATHLINPTETAVTHKHGDHPRVSDEDDIWACPAMSKAIRFEKPSAKPARPTIGPDEVHADLSDSLKTVSKRLSTTQVPSWLLVLVFGAVVVGAIMSGRGTGGFA